MIGGGQLARMTHRAAIDLGIALHVMCPSADEPAPVAGAHWVAGEANDLDAMRRLAAQVDVVTLDHELVDNRALTVLVNEGRPVHPSPGALAYAQNKHVARSRLGEQGFPVPPFRSIDAVADVARFAGEYGWPVVLKTPTGGYDGRGVAIAPDAAAVEEVLAAGASWMVEQLVPIATEIAVLVARAPSGNVAVYPVIETVQVDGICTELVMPARISPALSERAIELGRAIAEAIDVTGIMAVELFVTDDEDLIINELATRPHNSGHATIEGAVTSQFSNHLRAVLNLPLGSTEMTGAVAVTVNVLGGPEQVEPTDRLARALADPDVHVHLYGKTWRPGRKLGHVTVVGDDVDTALEQARRAAAHLTLA